MDDEGYAYYANYTIKENSIIDESSGWDVMSTKLYYKNTDIVCANGGHILEFGFGMGISADLIQEYDIESHTIIEINDTIYDSLVEWAKDKPNVIPVKVIGMKTYPLTKNTMVYFTMGLVIC